MDRPSASDAELIEATRRGDRAAFGELVTRCARMVDAVSYAATRDRTLSEDITQDTFVTAWRDLDRLRDAGAVRPWLCSIARNLAHKARRERRRHRITSDPDALAAGPTPFDAVHQQDVEHALAAALARVPDVYREALVMFYYEQRSARDVAAALGVTEDVVHKRVSRGRRHLASGIEPLVEQHVRRRRSRAQVAVCVLAALALAPSKSFAANQGARMWKFAGLVATALVAGTIIASHHGDAAADDRSAHRTIVTIPRPAAAPPQLPPAAPPCAPVVRHIIDLSLADHDIVAADHADTIRAVTAQLEQQCHDEWTSDELACMRATTGSKQVEQCLPREVPSRPKLPALGPDQPCDAVGAHVADLELANERGVRQDNVAAAILTNPDELIKDVQDQCVVEQWSEDQRRCFAAATIFAQIILCRMSY